MKALEAPFKFNQVGHSNANIEKDAVYRDYCSTEADTYMCHLQFLKAPKLYFVTVAG